MARTTERGNFCTRYALNLIWTFCVLLAIESHAAVQTPNIDRVPAPVWVDLPPADLSVPTPHGHTGDGTYYVLADE